MSGFSDTQTRALKAKLSDQWIRQRQEDDIQVAYIEGWHAIAEANRIFGFDGWDRETIEARCVWHGSRSGRPACSYVARVRITVRADDRVIIREGSGCGHGDAFTLGEAHEAALKEAETVPLIGDASRIGHRLGWRPTRSFADIVNEMVERDLTLVHGTTKQE